MCAAAAKAHPGHDSTALSATARVHTTHQAGKRAAQPLTPATQQPGKKQKAADGRPAAASAPARAAVPKTAAAAAAGAGSPEAAFRAALVAELRKAGGNMSLSALGSKVRRGNRAGGAEAGGREAHRTGKTLTHLLAQDARSLTRVPTTGEEARGRGVQV